MPAVSRLPSGRWRLQYRDDAGRQVSGGRSFPTASAARQFGLDREAEVRRGDHFDPRAGRVTLRDFAELWFDARVAERRTLAKDRSGLDRHVLPALGGNRLNQLNHLAVQGWVRQLERDGLAPATVRGLHRLLHQVLAAAVLEGKLPTNPADKVKLPVIAPPGDFHWSRDEISATADHLDGQDRVVFELLVGTGIRWGELAGLHADRVDLLRRRLTVAEVLEEEAGLTLKAYPKGGRRREVPLAPDLRTLLAEHLAVLPPLKPCGLQHPARQRCSGLLFHTAGHPLSRHRWPRAVFAPALAAAGARPGRVHDLRHTYASHLVREGIPLRLVQDLLGHASSRTTERYAHLAPDALDDARLLAALSAGRVPMTRRA